jgi:hypothetical protein
MFESARSTPHFNSEAQYRKFRKLTYGLNYDISIELDNIKSLADEIGVSYVENNFRIKIKLLFRYMSVTVDYFYHPALLLEANGDYITIEYGDVGIVINIFEKEKGRTFEDACNSIMGDSPFIFYNDEYSTIFNLGRIMSFVEGLKNKWNRYSYNFLNHNCVDFNDVLMTRLLRSEQLEICTKIRKMEIQNKTCLNYSTILEMETPILINGKLYSGRVGELAVSLVYDLARFVSDENIPPVNVPLEESEILNKIQVRKEYRAKKKSERGSNFDIDITLELNKIKSIQHEMGKSFLNRKEKIVQLAFLKRSSIDDSDRYALLLETSVDFLTIEYGTKGITIIIFKKHEKRTFFNACNSMTGDSPTIFYDNSFSTNMKLGDIVTRIEHMKDALIVYNSLSFIIEIKRWIVANQNTRVLNFDKSDDFREKYQFYVPAVNIICIILALVWIFFSWGIQ